MAKKSKNQSQRTIERNKKAQAERKAKEQADRRTRNIIIGVVVVIILAIIATLVVVVMQSKSNQSDEVPSAFSQGQPIVVSQAGIGQKDEALQDLTLNFSYTCHACATFDVGAGSQLINDALAGDFNLLLQPVNTSYMEFQGPATNAALQVAANDPENFVKFHQALMTFADEQINQKQDATIVNNLASSQAKVAELARTVGVKEDVIAAFGDSAQSYLTAANEAWGKASVQGRTDRPATPELVFADTLIPITAGAADEVHGALLQQLQTLGLTTGTAGETLQSN